MNINIGHDRRLSLTSHKGPLDYSGRKLSSTSSVAEECIECYLRTYLYFNDESPLSESFRPDTTEKTEPLEYELNQSSLTDKPASLLPLHSRNAHRPSLTTTLEASTNKLPNLCFRCHRRRFLTINNDSMSSTENRFLGPGLPYEITLSVANKVNDSAFFIISDFIKLQIDQGETEPIFGHAFLYDVHSRSRISETFHFDTNSDNLFGLFTGGSSDQQLNYRELTTMSKTCLFRISRRPGLEKLRSAFQADTHLRNSGRSVQMSRENDGFPLGALSEEQDTRTLTEGNQSIGSKDGRHSFLRSALDHGMNGHLPSGIFLVVRVDKVLQQGDISDILELYNKDDKNKSKLRSIVYWCCQRLGRYRMPLAWTAIDLTAVLLEANARKVFVETKQQSTHERSRSPNRSNSPDTLPRSGRLDKRSHSVGPSRGTSRFSHPNGSDVDDHLLFTRVNQKDDGFCDDSQSLDRFIHAELNITTFYRWELDKPYDEELGRCLAEIHRNSMARLAVADFAIRVSPIPFGEIGGHSGSTANATSSIKSLVDALSISTTTLKRLKTLPNLSLRLRLHGAGAFQLPALLKLLGSRSPLHGLSHQRPVHRTVRSLPLLSPESLPYNGSFFHTLPRSQPVGRIAPHPTLEKSISNPHDVNGSSVNTELRPIREVLELPSPQLAIPFTTYRNLLYVYPRSVSFPASRQASSRNIAICVQLLCTDGDVTKSLPAIFGRSNSQTFVREAFTTVLYHTRSPELFDEIKIQLPSRVDENLYLLFTFYHVSCQSKKVESSAALDSVIGYSWLPVLYQGSLRNADVNLLVSTVKPTSALAKLRPDLKEMTEKFHVDAFKWVDAHRELFHVSIMPVSSVYPQDAHVEILLSAFHPCRVLETMQGLKAKEAVTHLTKCIAKASLCQVVAFMAPLLDGLLRLVAASLLYQPSTDVSEETPQYHLSFRALHLLCTFAERLITCVPEWNDAGGRNWLLTSYLAGPNSVPFEQVLAFRFSNVPLFGLPSMDELVNSLGSQNMKSTRFLPSELIRVFLTPSEVSDERIERIPTVSWWFIFEILVRLLAEYAPSSPATHTERRTDTNGLYKENDIILNDLSRFISTFTRRLILRIDRVQDVATRTGAVDSVTILNRSLAYFLFDLFTLVPGQFVLSEIVAYHRAINERIRHISSTTSIKADHWELEMLIQCKLDLLRVVCSHERYLSLTGVMPTGSSLLLDQMIVENGHVKCVQQDQMNGLTLPLDPEQSRNHNVLAFIVASELKCCLNLNSPKLQNQATLLLWNVLMHHERSAYSSGRDVSSGQNSWFNRLTQVALLYLVLLDIGCQLTGKVVATWQAVVAEQKCANKGASTGQRDTTSMDDTSERSSIFSADGTSVKGHTKRRKTLPRIHKGHVLGARFPPGVNDGSLFLESSKSTFLLLPDEVSDSPWRRISESDSAQLLNPDTMQRLLTVLLWTIRYMPRRVLKHWLCQATPETRIQLVTLLYVIVNLFEFQGSSETGSDRASPIPSKFPADKRLYASAYYTRNKHMQVKEIPRDISSPRLSILPELGSDSSSRAKVETGSRFRSNSCTPFGCRLESRSFIQKGEAVPNTFTSSHFANECALSVAETLDRIIWDLWEYDSSRGQPGHSLFTVARSTSNHAIPYGKQNDDDSGNCSLLDTVLRVQLFSLSLNQSSASHVRFLLSLRHVMTKFPSYLFEDSPELFAAATYHLLALCASGRAQVRSEAVITLYLLMRNHFILTKNLVCVKTHLHTAFGALFATNELRERSSNTLGRSSSPPAPIPLTLSYLTKLRTLPLSQLDTNLNDALVLLCSYAESDRDFVDTTNHHDRLTPNTDVPNSLLPTGSNQAVHAVFQAIEDDMVCRFSVQVTQLAENVRRLFADVVRLQNKLSAPNGKNQQAGKASLEHSFSVIDLLHSIANRHRACPELRLFWLMQITEKHYELSQFAEAAQCLCHCAAIVAEHLVNRGIVPTGIAAIGCSDIAEAVGNMNLLEDSCICGPGGPSVNGICCPSPLILPELCPSVTHLDTSWYFSPAGWAALIAWTAGAFAKADSHELIPRIYSRLIPVLEFANDYTRLAEVHGRIKDAYMAMEMKQRGKRLFSAYFRVGFYGSLFNELNGLEFIYKEPPLTKLAEITQRLSSFYGEQFGEDRVVVVQDSKLIDQTTLDPQKAHLQITYVEPYFEDFELRNRKTEFQRNYALKRFVYCIPFTTSGAAHGSIGQQFQRKHILTAARCFPYVKSRLVVVATAQHILSPIEVALEDVSGRVKQLEQALSRDPIDVKFLQMVLQGGIGTTVNLGPVEVATTFLRPPEESADVNTLELPPSSAVSDKAAYVDCQNRLRICFRQLLDRSHKALLLNQELIGPDQVEYHRELERNYTNVCNILSPLLEFQPFPELG